MSWLSVWRARAPDREKAAIARAFNRRYTYREEWVKNAPRDLPGSFYGVPHSSGHAWMCPTCNAVHRPIADSVFSGLQYPRCCAHGEGDRLEVLRGA